MSLPEPDDDDVGIAPHPDDEPTHERTFHDELTPADRAVDSDGFTNWLNDKYRQSDPEMASFFRDHALEALGGTLPFIWNFEQVRVQLADYWASIDIEECNRVMDALAYCESEWRLDRAAGEKARSALELEKRPVKGVVWRKPTPGITSHQCDFTSRVGRTCHESPVPGSTRCEVHGGALVDEATRRAVLLTSYMNLVDATGAAVTALVDVATSSRNDLARVQAAKEILDRAGLTAALEVSVSFSDSGTSDRMSELRKKLDSLHDVLSTDAANPVITPTAPPTAPIDVDEAAS